MNRDSGPLYGLVPGYYFGGFPVVFVSRLVKKINLQFCDQKPVSLVHVCIFLSVFGVRRFLGCCWELRYIFPRIRYSIDPRGTGQIKLHGELSGGRTDTERPPHVQTTLPSHGEWLGIMFELENFVHKSRPKSAVAFCFSSSPFPSTFLHTQGM
jgi:hypothetical protein